jgi:adenylate kinase
VIPLYLEEIKSIKITNYDEQMMNCRLEIGKIDHKKKLIKNHTLREQARLKIEVKEAKKRYDQTAVKSD